MDDARRRDLLLVALTFAAGAVDAIVFLRLDVFTAVMTGNIVLLGLAIGQGAFRNALRSLIALAAYAGGVLAAARLVGAIPPRRFGPPTSHERSRSSSLSRSSSSADGSSPTRGPMASRRRR